MSTNHKLYHLEITPPPQVWEKISQELEEAEQYKTISKKLEQASAEPPAFIWNAIEQELNDEQLYVTVSSKLTNIEIAPPENLWNKIEDELATQAAATRHIADAKKGGFNWKRFAVAASVAGLLGFLGYRIADRSNKDTEIILTKIIADNDKKSKLSRQQITAPASRSAVTNNNHHAQDSRLLASNASPVQQVKTSSGNTYITTVEKNKDIQGRYIVLMTEDGNVVRMSKKLKNMADCVAGESESAECTNQISKWQSEVAKAPISANPDNFLDILALANSETAGM